MTATLETFAEIAILPNEISAPALTGIVDLFPSEEHELSADVSTYPVESGASLVDNVIIRPKRLKMSGRVANLLTITGPTTPGRASDAWQAIISLMEQRERMTISTTLGDYDNMVITRVKAPVDVRTGLSLHFEMHLQEILTGVISESQPTPATTSGDVAGRTAAVDGGLRSPLELGIGTGQIVAPRGRQDAFELGLGAGLPPPRVAPLPPRSREDSEFAATANAAQSLLRSASNLGSRIGSAISSIGRIF